MNITGNYVQGLKNKLGQVIKGAFKPADHTHSMDEIEDLHVDNVPTADSNNLVTSGGVKTELDKKIDSSLIQNLKIIEDEQEGSIEISFDESTILNLDNYSKSITLVNIKYGSLIQVGVPTCGGILLCRNTNLFSGREQYIYIGKYVYHRTYEANLQHRGWSNWTKNELYS